MLYKITFTHFVCAAIVLNVVHSAPSQTNRETLPHRHEDRLLATNLPASSLSHSNDPERTVHNGDASHDNQQNGSSRMKRAIIFRPLFVYRQQEIKKQKLNEMRQQQQQQIQQQQQNVASAACAACQHYQQSTRQPVRYYAQQYPYQRW